MAERPELKQEVLESLSPEHPVLGGRGLWSSVGS
jgi:hypothetical protein